MDNRDPRQPVNQNTLQLAPNARLAALAQRQREIEQYKAQLQAEEAQLAAEMNGMVVSGLRSQVHQGRMAQ